MDAAAASFAQFAECSRRVAERARALGLSVPSFRSPPRQSSADRTLRRRRDGGFEVAVRVRGRSAVEVAADIVEGVVATNDLAGEEAIRARTALLAAAVGKSREVA